MESSDAIKVFAALAQETRLSVFRHLVRAGPDGLRAGQIAKELDLPPATLSFHLKELAAAGLVRSQRFSRLIVYSPAFSVMKSVLQYLTENCCEGSSCYSSNSQPSQRNEKAARQSRG